MKNKEILEQTWLHVDEWISSTTKWAKEQINDVLWKSVPYENIPESYQSWIDSSKRAWSVRSSKFIYGESLKDIIWVILVDYSYYPWWGCWMEYWVKLFAKRWKDSDYRRIVYRDAYSSSGDDWWKAYNKIDSIEVKWDRVIVNVSSNSRKDSYSFNLKKNVIEEQVLSKEAQEEFRRHVESEKLRLIKHQTRENWIMPSNYDLVYMKTPNPQIYDRKYEEAEVIDESIDLWKWECYLIIKTQIDANAADGIQYAWYKYKITLSATTLVEQESAYQSQLKDWKRIKMKIR